MKLAPTLITLPVRACSQVRPDDQHGVRITDTQGVMGMHYARHDGEAEDVAVALNEQYQPRFAGDDLPY